MKKKRLRIPKNDKLVTVSVTLAFVCLLLFSAVLGYRLYTKKEAPPTAATKGSIQKNPKEDSKWETFLNEQYSFQLEIPKYLIKQEALEKQGYNYLVFFAENQYSEGKGVAVGVTDRTFDEELKEVKRMYGKEEDAELVEEKDIVVSGEKGRQLSYKPKEGAEGLEEKDVVIVRHGQFTFTVSTTPEQLPHILETYTFL